MPVASALGRGRGQDLDEFEGIVLPLPSVLTTVSSPPMPRAILSSNKRYTATIP